MTNRAQALGNRPPNAVNFGPQIGERRFTAVFRLFSVEGIGGSSPDGPESLARMTPSCGGSAPPRQSWES